MRPIDADKLYPDCLTQKGTLAISQSQLANAPTIIPDMAQVLAYESGKASADRPTGKWIDTGYLQKYWAEEYQCSLCGAKDYWHNYCPNCGAKMKQEVRE